ncbi:MAG: hypothetical protein AAF267_21825, partial [Deinococcota bacterium]
WFDASAVSTLEAERNAFPSPEYINETSPKEVAIFVRLETLKTHLFRFIAFLKTTFLSQTASA